ncbi:hypothetical protein PIB30_046275 [Stylosanthes scabra]|uniref:Uncharacterized protein n=1 Tax=Stylosanthes scabra TaxID=79078 RepID=A0ABU6ZF74_9FABA|nr:hypothetical protein [Stylosanthes scabra]
MGKKGSLGVTVEFFPLFPRDLKLPGLTVEAASDLIIGTGEAACLGAYSNKIGKIRSGKIVNKKSRTKQSIMNEDPKGLTTQDMAEFRRLGDDGTLRKQHGR